jgi:dihydrofolate reductase
VEIFIDYNLGMPRKVILGFGISIDGYIARRNGAMDYLLIDEEGEVLMADFFAKIDTTIMGRKTAAATAEMRRRGEIPDMPGMSTYVFSRRWKAGKRDGFEVMSGSLTAFVRKLKRHKGKDIYLGGGGQLCRSFLQEDLVDELFLGLAPVLLGDGIPGFPGKFPQRDFKLTECKSYSNGSVGLRYERMRTKSV